jgi:chromosome partitioning protein
VRKLLVASQKGGVGKSTTSMNLAAAAAATGTRVLLLDADPLSNVSMALNLGQHPRRQLLRQAGIELPGVLVQDIVPGLDVLSPYEEGRCSDEDFDHLLQALSSRRCADLYGCLIIDSAPFMGHNPDQLLRNCDEMLLVMRAEAMAYRTLPAFLELVQRSRRPDHDIEMRGILLTLPEGEDLGGRWERELRGRFGNRILSEVIPHDEVLGKALETGQISSHSCPDSAAARQYHLLSSKLGLTGARRGAPEQVALALRETAASFVLTGATTPSFRAEATVIDHHSVENTRDLPASAPEEIEAVRPDSEIAIELPKALERSIAPVLPPLVPTPRIKAPPPAAPPARAKAPRAPRNATPPGQRWPLWVALGAVFGGGLRFLPHASSVIPFIIGLCAAGLVFLAFRWNSIGRRRPAHVVTEVPRPRPRSQERKKTPTRPINKNDLHARLAALKHAAPRSARRTPHDN